MKKLLGIRREDKNIWERRVPIIPEHVKKLKNDSGIDTIIQPFPRRAFSKEQYENADAVVDENISDCPLIVAVKEIPINLLEENKTYIFFSHTIKGQDYNMPLLKKLMELKCTLIDYETITDENNRRLVFFGQYAGLAGMIETLYGIGKRLQSKGIETPFLKVKQAFEYSDLTDAQKHIREIAEEIKEKGLPEEISPYVIGFPGYGNVSQGAQRIFDLLPHKEITPEELLTLSEKDNKILYKVVFKEKDLSEPIDPTAKFELQEYYDFPEKFKSKFEKYLDKIDVLVNCIYWTEKYPRLVTKNYIKENKNSKLDIICDISCDINGSIEITHTSTEPDMPAFVYNPDTDSYSNGFTGEGVVNIAVDNLPTELPVDSSRAFSDALSPFIPGVLNANLDKDFKDCEFPDEIKRATILYKGELTPGYKYLDEYL